MTTVPHSRRSRASWRAVLIALLALVAAGPARTAQPAFFPDDPLPREPETQDAAQVQPWDIDLAYDLARAYFVTSRRPFTDRLAGNVNTVDEVPDSSWFTNRIGTRALSLEELVAGPNVAPPPDESAWTVIREKSSGFAAGFTARDARGETWFISFDAPANPEGATGAIVVATKIFWALGYNQVENHLAAVRLDRLTVAPTATIRRPSGRRTPMTDDDLRVVMAKARPRPDGSYRVAAGRLLPGKVLGGFRYDGTRPDDPNDVVEHQHRRELRALGVFGAWVNLTDLKAGNTLDTLVSDGGQARVRHYLQDVGSTFGVGAQGPHDWSEGWEYVIARGPALRRLFSLGFAFSRWQTVHYDELPAIGRFEGQAFDPREWRPRAPVHALLEMRDDDAFWAARRVMAFSDDAIRAVVGTARFSDPKAAALLARVLIERRDRIGKTYLPRVNPVVTPALDTAGVLTFANAAVDHGVAAPPQSYHARWFAFDNHTRASTPIGDSTGATPRVTAPGALPTADGAFVRVDIAADDTAPAAWRRPVQTYFRRHDGGWTLVGLVRMPSAP